MKKKMIMSITIIVVVATFSIISVSVGHKIETEMQRKNSTTAYSEKRGAKESEAWGRAIEDSDVLRKTLERNHQDLNGCKQKVKDNLHYVLEHFSELEKGNDAEISITAKLTYSSAYIYYLVLYSDYDQKVYTENERTLMDTPVQQYVNRVFNYSLTVTSNTQEKADLLKAQSLARQLSKSLDEEVEVFVNCLVDVIEEGKK